MALAEVAIFAIFCAIIPSFDLTNFAVAQLRNDYLKDPNIYYTTMELICADGYPVQEHKVVTDDGYILTVHRIPNAKRRAKVKRKPSHYLQIHQGYHPDFENCVQESMNETSTGMPVIMVHGIIMASDGWVLQGPGYDFAYILADAGYDVWMVNVRGNFYSRAHKFLEPSDPKFWNFSHHENAYYDLPATIDYILKKTNQNKIFYIGYSMGTAIFFSMMSIRPELSDKVMGFVGLAPVVYTSFDYKPQRRKRLALEMIQIVNMVEKKNVFELLPRSNNSINWGSQFCSKKSQLQNLCYNLISIILGTNTKLVLKEKLHMYLTHFPAGTSMKTLRHFISNMRNNRFKYFDYGPKKNRQVYGSPIPPDYPIWNMTTPIALYYSVGDFFYEIKDQEYLQQVLTTVVEAKKENTFNHADYIWSFAARDSVYYPALNVMNKIKNQQKFESNNEISGKT